MFVSKAFISELIKAEDQTQNSSCDRSLIYMEETIRKGYCQYDFFWAELSDYLDNQTIRFKKKNIDYR